MPRYRLAGLALVTETALPELVAADDHDDGPAWRFEMAGEPPRADLPLVHEAENDDGTAWLRIEGGPAQYVLRFTDAADFVVSPATRTIACCASAHVGASTLRHLLLDQVVPHILALDGSLVLHASAVAASGGAVAFVGPSGFGKSSLAASFLADGHALVTDDFVLLVEDDDGFAAVSSYPGLRLWPDSAEVFEEDAVTSAPVSDGSDKRRVLTGPDAQTRPPIPLRAIVVLGDPWEDPCEDISVRPITAREALMAVYQQAFRMERSGRERQLAEFDRFARLVTSTVLLRADYPREYESLPAVRAAILDALGVD